MTRRVALFRSVFLPASQTFIHDEIRAHRRYEVEVFARRVQNLDRFPIRPVHAVRDASRPLSRLEDGWVGLTGFSRRFDRQIAAGRFDLLHAHFGYCARLALPYRRRHGLPLVVTFHGVDVAVMAGRDWMRPRWWSYALSWRGLLREADLLLAASTDLRDLLLELGADPARTVVYRIGVDLSAFALRARPPAGPPAVLMVGRFVEKKGFEYGLRAFARVARERDVTLVIAGEGERRGSIEAEARAAGLASKVRFVGAVPHAEVARLLAASSVLLAPSVVAANRDRDSGLLVVKEAAASGVPAIGSLHGGIPEIIDDGVTGYLVPERDVEAMASRLRALLDDDALRQRLGAAARRKMEQEYDIGRRVEVLEDLYDRAVADSARNRALRRKG